MAKCSAHGSEIGTIYTLTKAYRYMSDGKVLKNLGFGWKLHSTVKDGIDPKDAYQRRLERFEQRLRDYPQNAAFRQALHDTCGHSKRWKLMAAISMMPDDPDGVWSEACDGYSDNINATIEDIVDLCRLYKLAMLECDVAKEVA